ncbi:MAG TPA: hypothetical protein VFD45_03285 [Patescibacteria group bacterium]|nr:hypothetical protein [Patescibacteria group bacterium]
MKEAKIDKEWDIKKIIITVFILTILIALVLFFKFYVFAENDFSNKSLSSTPSIKQVEGVSTSENPPDIKKAVQEKVNLIKEEAASIDVIEIASSSPQVQKVINDLKELEKYPSNQAKSMCNNICDQL